jgi:hypothetical protein
MRKLFCSLAILALVAPVFAGSIVLTVDDNQDGTFTVGYSSYTGAAPVGLALEIDASVGEVISAQDLSLYDGPVADSFFDVFVDFISDNTTAYAASASTATGSWLGTAHPLAVPGTVAGSAVLPRQDVSICMGSLVGTAPASVATLARLTIGDGQATGCILDLDSNRDGIVDADGNPMTATCSVNGGTATALPVTFDVTNECYAGRPDYATWVAMGSPECWCYPRQCHGDADGCQHLQKGSLPFWVGVSDLTILTIGWKKGDSDSNFASFICADFDHISHIQKGVPWTFRVGVQDMTILSTYWKAPNPPHLTEPPADCLPGNRAPATCP